MVNKFIEGELDQNKEKKPAKMEGFDTFSKANATMNQKVIQKQQYEQEMERKKKYEKVLKSVPQIEKEALKIVREEVQVIVGSDFLTKIEAMFNSCKEKGKENEDFVEFNELIASIAEDEYFDKMMNVVVRVSTDNETEILEDLLHRMLKCHKEDTITFNTFIGYFSKRGRIRINENVELSPYGKRHFQGWEQGLADLSFMTMTTVEDPELK